MGIDVYWKNESDEILCDISDADFVLADLSDLFHRQPGTCTRYIDPAGDACFNQLQLPDLASELRQVRNAVTEPRQLARLDDLIALVTRAHGTSHSYIRFVGD